MVKMKKRFFKRALAFVLALMVCVAGLSLDGTSVMAATQKPTAAASKSKIYSLVKKYDPDVYDLLKTKYNSGYDFMVWFQSSDGFMDEFMDAVHETFHVYVSNGADFRTENIYVGGNVSYSLDYSSGNFFKTEKMAKKIPENLRTFRYNTYVKAGTTASANVNGAYGLMNEFGAYYWGLRATTALMGYYRENADEAAVWKIYAGNLANSMNAYAEFKYWILRYMVYAKKNYPSVYKAMLKDEAFCNAYTAIETQFAALIDENLEQISGLNDFLEPYGYTITTDDGFVWCSSVGHGSGSALSAYELLMEELQKDTYITMDSNIKKHATNATAKAAISRTTASLEKGESLTLSLNNTKKKITWSSGNKNVATVNSKGKVTARSKGVTVISAKAGKKTFYCTISVE